MLTELASDVGLIAAAIIVLWPACERLERASHTLAQIYGLPEVVKGSVVMAVSSSFPELATVVLAGWLHGDFGLGLATVIGSAVFNILVIPGLSVFFRPGLLRTDRSIVFRETQFYLVSVMVFLVALSLSVIYNPHLDSRLQGAFTRWLALLPLGFYLLYMFIQYHEVRDHPSQSPAQPARPLLEWVMTLASMLVIMAGVELLIRTVVDLGGLLGTPSYFWGATIIAAATSVPDLFMSIRAARRKISVSSLTNALGSNIFDLLVVVPAGVLAAGTVRIDYPRILPMMAFLILATIGMLVLARRDFALSNRDGAVLLALYGAFIVMMVVAGFGVPVPLGR
jgi:cation:H+ antiporter